MAGGGRETLASVRAFAGEYSKKPASSRENGPGPAKLRKELQW